MSKGGAGKQRHRARGGRSNGHTGTLLWTMVCSPQICRRWLFHRVLWRHTHSCDDHCVTISSLVAVKGVPSVLFASCTVGS